MVGILKSAGAVALEKVGGRMVMLAMLCDWLRSTTESGLICKSLHVAHDYSTHVCIGM